MARSTSHPSEDSLGSRVRRAVRGAGRGAGRSSLRSRSVADEEAQRAAADAEVDRRAERFAERVATQWQTGRERRAELSAPSPIIDVPSRTGRAEVPYALDAGAAWAWRLLLIGLAVGLAVWTFWFLRVVSVPLVIALLLTALFGPVATQLQRLRVPRSLAALTTVIAMIGLVTVMLTFVGNQISEGFSDLSVQVAAGIGQVEDWLRTGPLQATDSQITDALGDVQASVGDADLVGRASDLTLLLGHLMAATAVLLLSTYFFLADGGRIWSWVVRLFPGGNRTRVDRAGRVAWRSVTQFVRATVVVAAVDAVGIMAVAAVLDVPLVLALGVLVFLGGFVPIIGAFLTGVVAVLVALVAQGPLVALAMFAGVVVVQQVESHVLQPFLMGRFVSVHPLAVILAIGVGVLAAGIIGALLAVPLVAALNAVVTDLTRTHDPEPVLADRGPPGDPDRA